VLFPQSEVSQARPASHPWVIIAICAGGVAFLLAGLLLRKGRHLDVPT
jgi:hypothetical protein